MRELKVYGGPVSLPHRGQERAVVLVETKTELVASLKAVGCSYVNARVVREYWAETANDDEVAAALAAGRGVVLVRPYHAWTDKFEILPRKQD